MISLAEYITNEYDDLKAYEEELYKYFLETMEILQGKLQENFRDFSCVILNQQTLKLHLYLKKNIKPNSNGYFYGSSDFEFEIGIDLIKDKTFYIKSDKFDYNVQGRKFDQELHYEIFIKEIGSFLKTSIK